VQDSTAEEADSAITTMKVQTQLSVEALHLETQKTLPIWHSKSKVKNRTKLY